MEQLPLNIRCMIKIDAFNEMIHFLEQCIEAGGIELAPDIVAKARQYRKFYEDMVRSVK